MTANCSRLESAIFFPSTALVYRRRGHETEADCFWERSNVARALMQQLVDLNPRVINDPNNAELRDKLAVVGNPLGKTPLAAIWRDAAQALKSNSSPSKLKSLGEDISFIGRQSFLSQPMSWLNLNRRSQPTRSLLFHAQVHHDLAGLVAQIGIVRRLQQLLRDFIDAKTL